MFSCRSTDLSRGCIVVVVCVLAGLRRGVSGLLGSVFSSVFVGGWRLLSGPGEVFSRSAKLARPSRHFCLFFALLLPFNKDVFFPFLTSVDFRWPTPWRMTSFSLVETATVGHIISMLIWWTPPLFSGRRREYMLLLKHGVMEF